VPVFGIVENMSYFVAPDTGNRYEIFGHGGAQEAAEELGLEFLGEVPLDMATREASDAGVPITEYAPDSPAAKAFMAVAEKIAARCSVQQFLAEAS
jgi:ATP-binding protein involved in chromosome partitioning